MVLTSWDNDILLNMQLKFCSAKGHTRSWVWTDLLFVEASSGEKMWWVNLG